MDCIGLFSNYSTQTAQHEVFMTQLFIKGGCATRLKIASFNTVYNVLLKLQFIQFLLNFSCLFFTFPWSRPTRDYLGTDF